MSDTPSQHSSDFRAKVAAIFRELVGEKVVRLCGSHYNRDAVDIIAQALSHATDDSTAHAIGFHLCDWNSDAAFIVAIQLFPERFTPEEIADGVEAFVIHAPNHVAAAAVLSGNPIDDIFGVGALKGPNHDE